MSGMTGTDKAKGAVFITLLGGTFVAAACSSAVLPVLGAGIAFTVIATNAILKQ